jgi:hypothetical protein
MAREPKVIEELVLPWEMHAIEDLGINMGCDFKTGRFYLHFDRHVRTIHFGDKQLEELIFKLQAKLLELKKGRPLKPEEQH